MSRLLLNAQPLKRSSLFCALATLALAASACGHPADGLETGEDRDMEKQAQNVALDGDPCTVTHSSPPPTFNISDSVITLQCGVDTWQPPSVTAEDACGNPLTVNKFNTGDDDGDSIPGSTDPDDFGPGPDASVAGTYYVSYLAIDSAYHLKEVTLTVNVVNCQP
ncbi:hypothetical protein POL68_12530 [Stigmatella sp. ncwal1]|uniref:Pesticidal crystal protein Cry22Aa Ig-like domain-containing protein n=1 Tax=Stigmatella ashevillensis TaxID=2995309 RepID=A0ABT5DAJ1_9BACT|nr:hypothetical protein [Stigmatella ashevillena]MDC0709291.1 hypothetical protein [Stigmatella ashevillena]